VFKSSVWHRSVSSPSARWILASVPGLIGIEEAVAEYRAAPSATSMRKVESIVSTEHHAATLNERFSNMLNERGAGLASRLSSPGAVDSALSLLARTAILDFSHSRLGAPTAPMTMEALKKRVSIQAHSRGEGGEGDDPVELSWVWELSRR
jgi:hypothetical protein